MVKIIPWILMPVSNAASWYLVVVSTNSAHGGVGDPSIKTLLQSVWKIAIFYMLWALYNKYLGGRPQELGHVSFGLLALTSYLEKRYLAMGACGLVVLNFAVVIPLVVSKGPAGLAKIIWKDTSPMSLAWAYTFTFYILSNVALWSYVLYTLYSGVVGRARSSSSSSEGGAEYEPIQHQQEGIL
mmetsp:Transcript_20179/g.32531  ORF Transcript_20179/g.32531 Transcript_20179/m.32531 type:complete len:184 (+) Transcript_20179:103-654(+)|eukprot:CAMPEP_0178757164 /NCGR_PEP_ID=MMETSP0744-20121128/13677_1 /TAXON_ID=913974 /ORGANISM="Nitzschia punctata, Strain CCMP561" /LENGTH=183 /DNA_ID=CAMNT_0020411385 /DNA_START=13 /DNA_END=564 /DNA_ORIENTATION=+